MLPPCRLRDRDELNAAQIEPDAALCGFRFPELICRRVAAQFMGDRVIATFSFEKADGELKVLAGRHYSLAEPSDLTAHGRIPERSGHRLTGRRRSPLRTVPAPFPDRLLYLSCEQAALLVLRLFARSTCAPEKVGRVEANPRSVFRVRGIPTRKRQDERRNAEATGHQCCA